MTKLSTRQLQILRQVAKLGGEAIEEKMRQDATFELKVRTLQNLGLIASLTVRHCLHVSFKGRVVLELGGHIPTDREWDMMVTALRVQEEINNEIGGN